MDVTPHDSQAWEEYRTRLLAFVQSRVGNPQDAEDLVHDVLARAYARRDTLENQSKLGAWLYQIARNAVIDYYRMRTPQEPLPEVVPAEQAEEDTNGRAELAQCLLPLIAALPAHYRDAVRLSELDGLTQRETAEKLGLSHSGAKSRVQRARAMLEAELLACCRVAYDSRGRVTDYEPKRECRGCS